MTSGAKSSSHIRKHIFPVRLSDVELEALQSRAKQAGFSASELMRRNALMRPLPKRLSRVSLQTYVELGRIGHTLNQLTQVAKVAINNGQPPPAAIEDLEALTQLLHQCRREIALADRKYLHGNDSDEMESGEIEDDWEAS